MNKASSTFVYVIYIRTTAEKLWDALTKPEFTKKYWVGTWQDCAWKPGASWKLMIPTAEGRVADSGEVVEIDKPRKLVLRWRNEFLPEMREEGYSLCTMELEPQGEKVKLTVTHTMDKADSKFIKAVSTGWPGILSGLKSLLETGKSFEGSDRWPESV